MSAHDFQPPASLENFLPLGLQDVEQLRLVLSGHSALDWYKLSIKSEQQAKQFLYLLGVDLERADDRAHLKAMYEQALTYLDTYIKQIVVDEVRYLKQPEQLLFIASQGGKAAQDACILLKVMHVSHHVAGRELLYQLPVPIQELFYRVEKRVFEAIDTMRSAGIKITQFEGSRKTKASIITKLLRRSDSLAAEVHDRIRFRIITEDLNSLFEALVFLTRNLFPFNYIVPGESRNDLLDLQATLGADPYLQNLAQNMQKLPAGKDASNPYSAKGFKMINFVVDLPVRVDDLIHHLPKHTAQQGNSIFLLIEFQLVDRVTHYHNSTGDNRHALYKERQVKEVIHRLTADREE